MIAEQDTPTAAPTASKLAESIDGRPLSPVMFSLAFVYLLAVAGLIHRTAGSNVGEVEHLLVHGVLLGLWPLFAIEGVLGYLRRSPEVPRWKAALRVLLVVALPPMRMAWIHPATNRIWLPRLGWRAPGKPLAKLLDKVFGGPMLVFAFLILPVLVLEYAQAEQVKTLPGFALALDVSLAVIWVAFAVEFVMKSSASPNNLVYLKERWLDLAIVGLPALEFVLMKWVDAVGLLRLLRLSRAMGPQQLSQMGRIYRLRGLVMKGWHAVMVFEVVARLAGNSPQKRLARVEAQIADLEEQLAELRAQEEELKKQIAKGEQAK